MCQEKYIQVGQHGTCGAHPSLHRHRWNVVVLCTYKEMVPFHGHGHVGEQHSDECSKMTIANVERNNLHNHWPTLLMGNKGKHLVGHHHHIYCSNSHYQDFQMNSDFTVATPLQYFRS